MIRMYLEFVKKSFQNNVVYRLDYLVGVINCIVIIFVNISIWKAIYEEEEVVGGIQFKALVTYIVLSFLIQSIFVMDEYLIENKIRSGLIASDFLKPISFRLYIFFYNIGTLVFRITMQLLPVLVLSVILFRILPPFSFQMGALFLVSLLLGYLVLYCLNFIVWITCFWFYGAFSMITIKDAVIMIMSGALVPLWFMPQWLMDIIRLTPFDSIYYIPISIYLGQVPMEEILSSLLKQAGWIALLLVVGQVLWSAARKKLVVQGG